MGALVVTGTIGRRELVVGGSCGGGVRSPTVLVSIRDRGSVSMVVVLNV